LGISLFYEGATYCFYIDDVIGLLLANKEGILLVLLWDELEVLYRKPLFPPYERLDPRDYL